MSPLEQLLTEARAADEPAVVAALAALRGHGGDPAVPAPTPRWATLPGADLRKSLRACDQGRRPLVVRS
jgi:hypothetical protein